MTKNIFGLTVSVALVLAAFSIAAAAPGNTSGQAGASGEAGKSAEIASLNAVTVVCRRTEPESKRHAD